ncbi:hypothetical protein KFZ76_09970 [Methylovulum psychrotolerans]|jgi:hypothetical protein|uniref:hypothetical protein n=1 Tax=Methylovulum psychrotolerans TaxID=1704499 RepID=UPI001BFF2B01|nr:hypothetical protein [Methylovulum psychrotolerans]MBT9098027.1 hypothetical protein [Methylovulum psychrotolerans]
MSENQGSKMLDSLTNTSEMINRHRAKNMLDNLISTSVINGSQAETILDKLFDQTFINTGIPEPKPEIKKVNDPIKTKSQIEFELNNKSTE